MAVLPKAGRELHVTVDRDGQRIDLRVVPDRRVEVRDRIARRRARPAAAGARTSSPAVRPSGADSASGDVLLAMDGEPGLDRATIIKHIEEPRADADRRSTSSATASRWTSRSSPRHPAGSSKIGVSICSVEMRRVDPTSLEAFKLSLKQNWDSTVLIGKTLVGLFTRDTPVQSAHGAGRDRRALGQRRADRLDLRLRADGDDQPQPRPAEPAARAGARRRPDRDPRASKASSAAT